MNSGQKTSLETDLSASRLSSIECLRGWAAVGVLVHHVAFFPEPHYVGPKVLNTVAELGSQGVSLFFIISAFTLTKSHFSRRTEPMPVMAFYLRRFFRIAPLLFAWLLARLIGDAARGVSHGVGEIIVNSTFSFNFSPAYQTGIVWTSWTVG